MIEKLKYTEHSSGGEDMTLRIQKIPAQPWEMQDKINEIVDAVNELQQQVKEIMTWRFETDDEPAENGKCAKNAQDLYAEQRKWIGKLCKFWFADAEHPTFGILDFVDAGLHPEPFHTDCGESEQGWYPHCEPVKPDDDIIYKGE